MKLALRCPRCAGSLRRHRIGGGAVLRCARCGPYPVLGGVPVLVPDPVEWCATFHDAALAALAVAGVLRSGDVETLESFAAAASGADPSRFGDDWTDHEIAGRPAPRTTEGPTAEALVEFLTQAERCSPESWLLQRVPPRTAVLEVGCGAGVMSERLARKARRLMVCDVSLRATLTARARSSPAQAVVADAEALPFADDAFEVVVAENLFDLVAQPLQFLAGASRIAPRVLLSTPDPHGHGELRRLAERAGLRCEEALDGLPWLRRHSPRHLEVYLTQVSAWTRKQTPKRRLAW